MADIARLAGVAVSTVSRALAGSPRVNPETRERIAELARSLNYSINVGAKNLRLKQNNTVAVVVPYDARTGQNLSDPFFLSLIGSLADASTEQGCDMLLSRVDGQRLDLVAQPYLTGRAMGVVLLGQVHHHDEQLNALAVRRVPLVVWGAQMPQQLYCTVGSDNLEGGRAATEHLLAQGAQHIAFIGDSTLPEIARRHEGYLLAHRLRGMAPDPRLYRPAPLLSAAVDAEMEALLRDGPPFDAVFAASDLSAVAVINVLRRHGKRVPDDVAVVGYDDIPLAVHYQPPLTTVRQASDAAGKALIAALMAQIAGERPKPVELPTELVVRGTTRPVAVPATPARARAPKSRGR
ncbi:MAG TPA: LacI family DNA-binding transcriptional regulator [Albitalea sp.]|nr:LacI family DNA-binding transcriptional regulator [Albitalea sp.]